MEPDMFDASCVEATINGNFVNKKRHHTNES